MRNLLLVLLLAVTRSALAYVPPEFQGDSPQPSGRPVHGPIRPNVASVNASGAARYLPRNHLRTYQGFLFTKSIFLGKQWTDSRFAGDKIEGIDLWYAGYTDSNYAHVLDQYFWIGEVLDYRGHLITTDPDLAPGAQDGDVAATTSEICKLISDHELPFIPNNSFYPIYVAKKRSPGGACAINATDKCSTNGAPFSYAIIYALDGDRKCDTKDHITGHSEGLASIANASARAVADLRTDWDFSGYYDKDGNEVDDKCAWTFNVPFVTFTNGSIWKLQGMWSDLDFVLGTGYRNALGERGCVDGQ